MNTSVNHNADQQGSAHQSSAHQGAVDQGSKQGKRRNSSDDVHLLDYFIMLARHRTAVAVMTLTGGLLFLAFTFLMRFTFTTSATLLPPEKQQMGGLMSFLAGAGALDIMKTQENPALDLFRNVLESRTLAMELARDPQVKNYYSKFDTTQLGIAFLVQESLTAEALRNGILVIQVDVETHWTPEQAEKDSAKALSAHLANLFASTLDKFNRERLMTTARNTRIFVEGEYHHRMRTLDSAYARLQLFQETNKAVSLPDQLSATVTAAAELGAQIQQLEIQLAVEKRELSPNSTRIQTLESQLSEAKKALTKFDDGTAGDYVVGLRGVPQLARTYAGLAREIKLLETLTAYLRQQWEQEKINEQRDLPSLQVLDPAIPPDRKSSPRRLSMLLLGMTAGFALSMIYVGVIRFRRSVKDDKHEHRRFIYFKHALRYGTKAKFVVTDDTKPGASGSETAPVLSEETVSRR